MQIIILLFRGEFDALHHRIPIGITQDLFSNRVTVFFTGIFDLIGWDTGLYGMGRMIRISFFLGKEILPVSHKKFHVTDTSDIFTWIKNLIENTMTQGESNI